MESSEGCTSIQVIQVPKYVYVYTCIPNMYCFAVIQCLANTEEKHSGKIFICDNYSKKKTNEILKQSEFETISIMAKLVSCNNIRVIFQFPFSKSF